MIHGKPKPADRNPVGPHLSPFLLVTAVAGGLVATVPLFLQPLDFAHWLKLVIMGSLALLLLLAALLAGLRRSRQHGRFRMNPSRLVKLDGVGFLLWFVVLYLFWITAGGLALMALLVLFGPGTWVVAFGAGLSACMIFVLSGSWLLARTDTLGLCWTAGNPAEIGGFFARADATFLLSKRYAHAVRRDLAQPRSQLREITRTLDLARAGSADRRIDLWSSGFAGGAREFASRLRVLWVLFSATCLLCLLLLALLPRFDLPPYLQAWARAGSALEGSDPGAVDELAAAQEGKAPAPGAPGDSRQSSRAGQSDSSDAGAASTDRQDPTRTDQSENASGRDGAEASGREDGRGDDPGHDSDHGERQASADGANDGSDTNRSSSATTPPDGREGNRGEKAGSQNEAKDNRDGSPAGDSGSASTDSGAGKEGSKAGEADSSSPDSASGNNGSKSAG